MNPKPPGPPMTLGNVRSRRLPEGEPAGPGNAPAPVVSDCGRHGPEHSTVDQRFPVMVPPPESCRRKANECAALARNVADSYSRAQLRQTAALWWQMAQSVETLEEIERKRAVTADVGATAPRAKQRTDPSMTLNKLRELGVHELNVLCLNPSCGHEITFNADDYGADTELSWFRPRMICARCGNGRLDVQPNF